MAAQHWHIDWEAWRAATRETTFARCNRLADERKRTHYQREAAIVEAHAVEGRLPAREVGGEAVCADERKSPLWWKNVALWDCGNFPRSIVEYAALLYILRHAYVRIILDIQTELEAEEEHFLTSLHDVLEQRGVSYEDAQKELGLAA